MKSIFSLFFLATALFLSQIGTAKASSSDYKLNETAIEKMFVESEDVTEEVVHAMSPFLNPNALSGAAAFENKSEQTAGLIALGTMILGGSIIGVAIQVVNVVTGLGFVLLPLYAAIFVPWHRLYLGTSGKGAINTALYCVTASWCGWLHIIDGIFLMLDNEDKYFDNPKYVMWL